jgi:hypothetical protein
MRYWSCDGCGLRGPWTADHQWYGSLKKVDESQWERIVVTCSNRCRAIVVRNGRVPADAELLAS